MTTEDDALRKIRGTFDELAQVGQRFRSTLDPAAGSALAGDDTATRPLPLSQHVWASLAACFDHLDVIRLTIEQQHLFPTASYSLLRGALLGACQGYWLISPINADERRERSRMFSQEWYTHRIRWQSELSPDLSVEHAAISGRQLKRFDDDLAALRQARTRKETLKATSVVELVAAEVFPDMPQLQRATLSEWRRTSGDAHALGWALMTQNTVWRDTTPEGLTAAEVTGSLASLANVYLAAWMILQKARRRLFSLAELEP